MKNTDKKIVKKVKKNINKSVESVKKPRKKKVATVPVNDVAPLATTSDVKWDVEASQAEKIIVPDQNSEVAYVKDEPVPEKEIDYSSLTANVSSDNFITKIFSSVLDFFRSKLGLFK